MSPPSSSRSRSFLRRVFRRTKNPLFWSVALVGIVGDQLTKLWIATTFPQVGHTIPLWPEVFYLTYVHNTGAAFSLFRGGANWLKWLSLGVSAGLVVYGWRTVLRPLEQLGYGCILAGAFGNGIDRFLFGYVVDFLDFRLINFPIFNLADVLINLGIAVLLMDSFLPRSLPTSGD